MANPTTNYGFVLPTPTDLVTDLPADFDVALQGVDTRLKALQPGTTLGDLAYSSATANTNTRLGIGSTGQILTVASGVPSWATPAATTFPAFRAHTNAQQTIPANTFTKITFATESFDTDSCFASSRFTPTKAGLYFFTWTLDLGGIGTRSIQFYLNGSDCGNIFFNATTSHTDMTNSNFISMNGTTDYMEVYAYCSVSTVVENGTVDSYFEGFGVRAL
jgi:hypothetical protein